MAAQKNIAIIGAGPSGLIAAEALAGAGFKVTVYDRMPSPARKFLIAGRGGLNLTHSEPLKDLLARYGMAAQWLQPMIEAYPPAALIEWCEGLGVETFVGSSGRVFPKSMKAVQLLRAWLRRLESLGVQYAPRHTWQGWSGDELRFLTNNNEQKLVRADATLLALGGASWPRLGSDGGWVDVLANMGVRSRRLRPANCGFIVPWTTYFATRFAGAALKPLSITHDGKTKQGEAIITARGMEGGVMYAHSAAIRDAIERDGVARVRIDFRPDMTLGALTQKLQAPRGSKSFSSYMRGLGFSPLIIAMLHEVMDAQSLSRTNAVTLAEAIKALPIMFCEDAGMARAISSAGGITRSEVDAYLMLNALPGVFVAGEMLDWEAPTGGYLLQGCFSTGVAAAVGIANYLA